MHGKLGLRPQPGPNLVEDEPLVKTRQPSRDKPLILVGKTHGSGANSVARPATSAVAPTVPKVPYIAGVNNGNVAPKKDLMKLLLASTEAAMG